MIELTEYMLITLIRLIIMISVVDVRVFGTDELSVRVSFMLFSIEFTDLGKSKRKRKLRKKLSTISFLFQFFKKQIRHTVVKVDSFDTRSLKTSRSLTGSIITSMASPAILAYLSAKSLGYTHNAGANGGGIDLTFSFPLYSVFISLLQAIYYNLKKKMKRRLKNA